MMHRFIAVFGSFALLATFGILPGCGDDDAPADTPDTGLIDTGPVDTGTATDTGTGTDTDDFEPPEPTSIDCGSGTCDSVPVNAVGIGPIAQIPPCCLDEATVECGLDLAANAEEFMIKAPEGCTPFELPGVDDASCPEGAYELPLLSLSIPLEPCCRPNGMCGLWGDLSNIEVDGFQIQIADLGCVDPDDYMDGYGDPVACDYPE